MRRAALLLALQAGVVLAWAGHHERVRATAPTFRIPLAPREPYDPLRRSYFGLAALDAALKTGQPDTHLPAAAVEAFLAGKDRYFDGPAFVRFCPVGDVHRVCDLRDLAPGPPPDGLWARSHVTVYDEPMAWRDGVQFPQPGWRVNVDLGADRFGVPPGTALPGGEGDGGWTLEVAHRPGLPLLPKRLWFRDAAVDAVR